MAINTDHSSNIFSGEVTFDNNQNSNAIQVTGGAIDCSLGNFFYENVSGNTTFTPSNIPTGVLYSMTLQINYTSGVVTLFVDTWVNGTAAPTFAAGTWVIPIWTYDGGTTWYGRGE